MMDETKTVEERLEALEGLAKELVILKPMLLKLDKVILQNPGFCPADEVEANTNEEEEKLDEFIS